MNANGFDFICSPIGLDWNGMVFVSFDAASDSPLFTGTFASNFPNLAQPRHVRSSGTAPTTAYPWITVLRLKLNAELVSNSTGKTTAAVAEESWRRELKKGGK